ncbi:MAG: serine hydrolase [Luteibacter jiangsuensis]
MFRQPTAGAIRPLHTLALGAALCAAIAMAPALADERAPAATVLQRDATPLDDYVARAMRTFDTPGVAIVVVDGDRIATHTYGVRTLGAPGKVGPHTLFPIGSNTKAFTAAALAILVDDGKLAWDDRVADHVAGFRMYDGFASQMTITDLLVHNSGLGKGQGDLMLFPSTDRTRAELTRSMRFLKPEHSFRASYDYDNVLYVVAGQLVQDVTGQTWEAMLRRRILEPLGMRDTQTDVDTPVADQVGLHGKNSTPIRGVGPTAVLKTVLSGTTFSPAGGLRSSAADMGLWLRALLRDGAIDDRRRVFSADAAKALMTPHTVIDEPAPTGPLALAHPQFNAYALGLEVSEYRGHKVITHLGGVLGAYSVTMLIPEKKVAFAVMVNAEDAGTLFSLREHLLDTYLGLDSPDWIGTYKQFLDKSHADAAAALKKREAETHPERGPSLAVDRYVGVYRDPWYGTATLSRDPKKPGEMRIRFDRTPGLEGRLVHVQYDTFRTVWDMPDVENAYVTFALTPEGGIERMTMAPVSPTADFSWDYRDLSFTPAAKTR